MSIRLASRRLTATALALVSLVGLTGLMGLWLADTSSAAITSSPNSPLPVAEANVDANKFIRVHEQGTVPVTGTVNVGNTPAVQNVLVTNTSVPVSVTNFPSATGTTRFFFQEFDPFNATQQFEVDIHEYKRIRILGVVNRSGTVHFDYETDAGPHGSFDVDAGGFPHDELLPEVPGTKMLITLSDADGEQVFLSLFGTK